MLNFSPVRLVAWCLVCFFSVSAALHGQEFKGARVPDMVPNADGRGTKIARAQEDFTSLTLDGSNLPMAVPLGGGQQVTPGFVRELWQVRWRPNDPIDLWVMRPAGVTKPPVVLYLFSYPSDTEPFKNGPYVQALVSHGVAAVGFVSALTGPRFQFRPLKQWFVSELQESIASSVHDVHRILDYLETRGDLDMSRVGMFGQGSGGAIAILAAASDSRIKTLDLLNPWGDWPDWLAQSKLITEKERPDFLTPDFLKKVEPLEPTRYLPELKDREIRIEYVDDSIPMKPAKQMESAAPPNAKVYHYSSTADFAKVASDWRLFNWISDQTNALQQVKTSSDADSRKDGLKSASSTRRDGGKTQ